MRGVGCDHGQSIIVDDVIVVMIRIGSTINICTGTGTVVITIVVVLFLCGILLRQGDFFPLPYSDGTITTL